MESYRQETDLSKPQKVIGQDISISEEENLPDLGGLY